MFLGFWVKGVCFENLKWEQIFQSGPRISNANLGLG